MHSITSLPIVLVDRQPQALDGATVALRTLGFPRVITVGDARLIAPTLLRHRVAAVVLEPAMLADKGRALLDAIAGRFPHIPVVVLTAINGLHTAVEYMRAGAVDYLVKPVEQSRLAAALRRALGRSAARDQPAPSANRGIAETRLETNVAPIVTQNPAMLELFRDIEAIAPSPQPALVTGESGTGKELVAPGAAPPVRARRRPRHGQRGRPRRRAVCRYAVRPPTRGVHGRGAPA